MQSCRWSLLCGLLLDRERYTNKIEVYFFSVSRYCSYQVFLVVARVLFREKKEKVGAVFTL